MQLTRISPPAAPPLFSDHSAGDQFFLSLSRMLPPSVSARPQVSLCPMLLDCLLHRVQDCIELYDCLLVLDHRFDCLAAIHLEHRLLDRHLD